MIRTLRKHWLLGLCLLLLLGCGVCLLALNGVKKALPSQQAARRWQGENDTAFAQISCFMPTADGLSMERLYAFRNDMAQKLIGASLDPQKDTGLYTDAWCSFGKVKVSAGRRSGEVQAVAVGGRFFDFHPLQLLSGNYLSPDDVMDDRVLLDRETAWLLFGGTELTGMSFSINGTPFVVAGVYERESDRFSKSADDGGMCIYMSWEGYCRLTETEPGIVCYELVMAEPVKGFVYSAVEEKFPIKTAELVDNSHRYEADRLLKLLKNRTERSMRKGNVTLPYWENAARASEDSAAQLLAGAMLLATVPAVLALYALIRFLVRGKTRMEDEWLPKARDSVEEAVRVRARRRWEKKHPGMK
ncbi:MAG: ABC transporter permease [Oscillospiraceae bacterium]|nr:ABC transporter permease [Oscillospiraceae bacterium]